MTYGEVGNFLELVYGGTATGHRHLGQTLRPPDLLASLPTTGLAHVQCGAAPLQNAYMESPTPTTATAF